MMRVAIHFIGLFAGYLGCSLVAPAAVACGTGQVLVQDNFDTLDAWGNLPSEVSGGGGMMRILQPPGRFYRAFNQTDFFTSNNICVDANIVAAGNLGAEPFVGIAFWTVKNDFYRFMVSGDGRYFIGRQWNGLSTFPRSWTTAASLKKGLNVWNEIEVRTRGNTASFRLNGVEVARINALQPANGGLVGLELTAANDKPATVTFRNFRIEADDKKGL